MTRHKNIDAGTLQGLQTKPSGLTPKKPAKRMGRPPKTAVKLPHPGGDAIPVVESEALTKATYQRMFDADESRANLRWQARVAYTTDINQCTVTDLAAMPKFAAVGMAQLQKWCWADGWHDERVRFLADLQKRMEMAISDEVTRQRLAYLKALKPAVESALKKFTPHNFEPFESKDDGEQADPKKKKKKLLPVCKVCGRWEIGHSDPFFGLDGDRVVNSLVKLVELDLTLSEVVARAVSGSTTEGKSQDGTDGNPPLAATVTSEEARIAAHAILRKRRAAVVPPDAGEPGGGRAVGSAAAPSSGND